MAGIGISYDIKGIKELTGNIETLKDYIATNILPFKEAASLVTGSVARNFVDEGRPKKWEKLSPITLFIRKYRAGKKNALALKLQDSGRLKNSFVPHAEQFVNYGEFGASTNVDYAKVLHNGGVSEPNTVEIGSFVRKAPHVLKEGQSIPTWAFKKRNSMSGMVRVAAYTMKLKGGATIPARPFMMVQEPDKPLLKQVFVDWMKGIKNGEYR